MCAESYLLSSGCFVGVKHPSADMYSSNAPFAGSSLKPEIKGDIYKNVAKVACLINYT